MGVPNEIPIMNKPTLQRSVATGTPLATGTWECVPVVTRTVHRGPHTPSEPVDPVPLPVTNQPKNLPVNQAPHQP